MEEHFEELEQTEVPFGKHKGKSLGEVYSEDPGYVRFIAEKDGMNAVIFRIFLAWKEN